MATYYFVLIIFVSASGSSGGNSVAMAQFRTKELCEAAAKSAKAVITYNHVQTDTICAPSY